MKAVGIDLTNASATSSLEDKSSWFPCVILPLIADEPVLAGEAVKNHRRGAGLAWPPECQIQYGNVPEFGKGRVTVAEAWRYLASFETQDLAWDNYQPYQRQISWQPNPLEERSRISLSAEDIVYEAMMACCPELTDVEQVCLVVPDDLGEGAQQALLDRLGAASSFHLTPRPVAIASDWCSRQQPDEFRIIDKKFGGCGYIWVLSMGLDRWEFCPLEIRKVTSCTGDVLIPVRDHTKHSSGLAIDGFSMLAAYGIGSGLSSIEHVWFDLTVGDLADKLINGAAADCFLNKYAQALESIRMWPGRLQKGSTDCSLDIESLRSELIAHAKKFKKRDSQCLGVVADGALAALKFDGVSIACRVLEDAYDDYECLDVSNGSGALKGAELVAQQLQQGLPTYRDRIAPISIYYLGRDEFLDPKIDEKILIESRTVEAGKVAKTTRPIKEFSIPQGKDSLSLILKREFGDNVEIKQVSAALREQTKSNEPVEITAEIRAGQGFAKAHVLSVKPGLFESLLNWRAMEKGERPADPLYAWPPGIANIRSTLKRRQLLGFREMRDLLADYNPRKDISWEVDQFRQSLTFISLINAEKYEYEGRISSTDSINSFVDSGLLQELSDNLGDAIGLSPRNKHLIRLAGWLFEACPSSAINASLKRIKQRNELPCDLEVAGKAFVKKEHIQVFVEMFVERIRELSGNYSADSNNNWIRAFRDMIRFRVNTLKKDHILDTQINTIEKYVIGLMYYESGVMGTKYDNCLYIAPHILKRRRFDDDFLAVNSSEWEKWMDMFAYAMENGKDRQKDMAAAMINFLNKQGTLKDVTGLVRNEAS